MKKVTKTLTGGLATVMASGMVPMTAMAATNFDELHKAAYDAVKVAQETKTQADINAARKLVAEYRTAIEAEGKDGLLVNINTFSELLDGVQQPILTDIVNKIVAMKEAGKATQAEINAVRELVDALPESLQNAVNTWSAEVDKFQNAIMEAAIAAVKTAETEKTQESIDAAQKLVDELATSIRPVIQKVAADLQARLDAVKVYDLNITKAELSKTSVTVEFEALEEALRDVTIEVIDNKGNVVEVKAKKLLIEGENTATFEFKNALNSRPDGVWYVNGFKVDAEAINLVNDVKVIATTNNNDVNSEEFKKAAEKLYQVLEKSSLVSGLVDEVANQKAYLTLAIERKAEKINTVADVQKIIDDGNKNVGSEDLVEAAVKAAKEGTLNQFKAAFAKLDLERVNSEWITNYRDALKAGATNLSDVQAVIDNTNLKYVKEAEADLTVDNKLNAERIEKAIDLVEKYVVVKEDDTEGQKDKEDRIAKLNVKLAIVGVNDADTQTSLKAALVNLEKVVNNEKTFKYDSEVNENLMADYVKARTNNNENVIFFNTVNEVIKYLNDVEKEQVSNTITSIREISEDINKLSDDKKDTKKKDLLDAFNKLALVSAKAEKEQVFDASIVKADLYDLYAKTLGTDQEDVEITTVSDVTKLVKAVNDNIVSILFKNNLSLNPKNLLSTLNDSRLGLTNVIENNREAYNLELSDFQRIEDKKELVKLVSRVNYKEAILAAKTTADVKANLVEYALLSGTNSVTDAKDAERSDIAEELLAIFTDDKAPDPTLVDAIKLNDEISNADSKRKSTIEEFNKVMVKGTPEITDAVSQLVKVSPEFKALSASQQLVVAEKVIANLPTHKDNKDETVKTAFTNYTEIRTLVSKFL